MYSYENELKERRDNDTFDKKANEARRETALSIFRKLAEKKQNIKPFIMSEVTWEMISMEDILALASSYGLSEQEITNTEKL